MPSNRQIVDQSWESIAASARMTDNVMNKMLLMQYKARKATSHLGPSMPMAVHIGEKPMETFVFVSPGEALERMTGNLISMRG